MQAGKNTKVSPPIDSLYEPSRKERAQEGTTKQTEDPNVHAAGALVKEKPVEFSDSTSRLAEYGKRTDRESRSDLQPGAQY